MPEDTRSLQRLGLNLLRLREGLRLSQEQLAEKAELDRTYISGIERGVRNPSLLSLIRLARAVGVSLNDLTKGVE